MGVVIRRNMYVKGAELDGRCQKITDGSGD